MYMYVKVRTCLSLELFHWPILDISQNMILCTWFRIKQCEIKIIKKTNSLNKSENMSVQSEIIYYSVLPGALLYNIKIFGD